MSLLIYTRRPFQIQKSSTKHYKLNNENFVGVIVIIYRIIYSGGQPDKNVTFPGGTRLTQIINTNKILRSSM